MQLIRDIEPLQKQWKNVQLNRDIEPSQKQWNVGSTILNKKNACRNAQCWIHDPQHKKNACRNAHNDKVCLSFHCICWVALSDYTNIYGLFAYSDFEQIKLVCENGFCSVSWVVLPNILCPQKTLSVRYIGACTFYQTFYVPKRRSVYVI